MAGAPGYTVEEAIADAREWSAGETMYEGKRGWRVCCAILVEHIDELERALGDLLDGCVALDDEQAILPQQMRAAREALRQAT